MNDLGVDYSSAIAGGKCTQDTADGAIPLDNRFTALIEDARAASGGLAPASGYSNFGSEHSGQLRKLQRFGFAVGEDTQGGAGDAASADNDSGHGFRGVRPQSGGSIPEMMNG